MNTSPCLFQMNVKIHHFQNYIDFNMKKGVKFLCKNYYGAFYDSKYFFFKILLKAYLFLYISLRK